MSNPASSTTHAPVLQEKAVVLFLAANPEDGTEEWMDLEDEQRLITESIESGSRHGEIRLEAVPEIRAGDLLRVFNTHRPTLVHFSGHGNEHEEITVLNDDDGGASITSGALESLFDNFKDCVRIAVLNACCTVPQARKIADIIGCAVGMNGDIGDDAAITFARAFYCALACGGSAKEAFDQGITSLRIFQIPEDNIPKLLERNAGAADAIFWRIQNFVSGRAGGGSTRPGLIGTG